MARWLVAIGLLAVICLASADPWVVVGKSVTYEYRVRADAVEGSVKVDIRLSNKGSTDAVVCLADVVKGVDADSIVILNAPTPPLIVRVGPSLHLLKWDKLRVRAGDEVRIEYEGRPLTEPPVKVGYHLFVNGREVRGSRVPVKLGDEVKVAVEIVNSRGKLLVNGRALDRPLNVMMILNAPEGLELTSYSVPPTSPIPGLSAKAWLLRVNDRTWVNVTYRVKSMGSWGEVVQQPLSLECYLTPTPDELSVYKTQAEALERELRAVNTSLMIVREVKRGLSEGARALRSLNIEVPKAKPPEELLKAARGLRNVSSYMMAMGMIMHNASTTIERELHNVKFPVPVGAMMGGALQRLANLSKFLGEAANTSISMAHALEDMSAGLELAYYRMLNLSAEARSLGSEINERLSSFRDALMGAEHSMGLLERLLSALVEGEARILDDLRARVRALEYIAKSSEGIGPMVSFAEVRPIKGYPIVKKIGADLWALDEVRVRGVRLDLKPLYMVINVSGGQIAGIQYYDSRMWRPLLNYSMADITLDLRGAVIPAMGLNISDNMLRHPTLGRLRVLIRAREAPGVNALLLYMQSDDTVKVERVNIRYSITIEQPTLSSLRKYMISEKIGVRQWSGMWWVTTVMAIPIACAILYLMIRGALMRRVGRDAEVDEMMKRVREMLERTET